MFFKSLGFKKYFQNISWLLFEKLFSLITGLVVGIYVARYLQPESYGLLNYSISFVGIFGAFSTLGLDSILLRELSKKPEDRDILLGTAVILRLIGSAVLISLLSVVLMFMGNDSFTNLLIYIIVFAELFRIFDVIDYYYQSKVLSKYVVRVQVASNLIVSLFKVSLILLHAPLVWFATAILVNYLLIAFGLNLTYLKSGKSILKWRFEKSLALNLIQESWPLIFYGFTLHIQARIDQVMLGKMLNNYEVGQYSVALKFIEMAGFIPMALLNTFSPPIAKAKAKDPDLYRHRLLNFYRLMFALFLVMAVPLYFLAEDLITLLYGIEYQPAGFLLSLFAIRLFFTNMGVGKSVFIVNESLFKYSLMTAAVGATVNISINYWLIPIYGAIGAIIATIISFSISIFLVDLFYAKTRDNQKLMFKGIFSFWKLRGAS